MLRLRRWRLSVVLLGLPLCQERLQVGLLGLSTANNFRGLSNQISPGSLFHAIIKQRSPYFLGDVFASSLFHISACLSSYLILLSNLFDTSLYSRLVEVLM